MATKKRKPRQWKADPATVYKVFGRLQPFTPDELVNINLPVREALQSLRDGTGTDVHYNTLAAVVNNCMTRGETIGQRVVNVAKDGQMAVLAVLDRYQRTGKWGMAHADLVHIEACVDLHERLLELSTPEQMANAMAETLRRLNAWHIVKKEPT